MDGYNVQSYKEKMRNERAINNEKGRVWELEL